MEEGVRRVKARLPEPAIDDDDDDLDDSRGNGEIHSCTGGGGGGGGVTAGTSLPPTGRKVEVVRGTGRLAGLTFSGWKMETDPAVVGPGNYIGDSGDACDSGEAGAAVALKTHAETHYSASGGSSESCCSGDSDTGGGGGCGVRGDGSDELGGSLLTGGGCGCGSTPDSERAGGISISSPDRIAAGGGGSCKKAMPMATADGTHNSVGSAQPHHPSGTRSAAEPEASAVAAAPAAVVVAAAPAAAAAAAAAARGSARTSSALTTRNSEGALAVFNKGASAYYRSREYKGLVPDVEPGLPTTVQKGRFGIAIGYEDYTPAQHRSRDSDQRPHAHSGHAASTQLPLAAPPTNLEVEVAGETSGAGGGGPVAVVVDEALTAASQIAAEL